MADDGLLKVNVTEIQEAEAAAFADQINKLLRHDEELKQRGILPITEPTPMVHNSFFLRFCECVRTWTLAKFRTSVRISMFDVVSRRVHSPKQRNIVYIVHTFVEDVRSKTEVTLADSRVAWSTFRCIRLPAFTMPARVRGCAFVRVHVCIYPVLLVHY